MSDINFTLVLFQLLNLIVLVVWLVLAIRAFRQLRDAKMSEGVRIGWAFLIVFFPVLGAVAFLSVRPGLSQTNV